MMVSKEHLINATDNFRILVTGLIISEPKKGNELLEATKAEIKGYEESKDFFMLEYAKERLKVIKSILSNS